MNRYLFAIVAIILLMCILETHARADTWAVATVTSYHFSDPAGHNQRNFGVGVEHELNERWSLMAGEYRNSLDRTSVYGGVVWKPWQVGNLHFGFAGGAISGYLRYPAPMVLPMMSWERGSVGANLFVAPHVREDSPGVIGLQVKVRW